MAQVQGEATIIQANCSAIHEYGNKKRKTYRPMKRETQIEKSETTRLNHQYAKRSKIHGSSGCATKPDINM